MNIGCASAIEVNAHRAKQNDKGRTKVIACISPWEAAALDDNRREASVATKTGREKVAIVLESSGLNS